MGLALNFVLTIVIELPIIALFFKPKKRPPALLMAFLINTTTWSIAHIVYFTTEISLYYVAIVLGIAEAIAFYKLMPCTLKKAAIMSLLVNSLSFFVTLQVPADIDLFPAKTEIIRSR